MVISDRVAVAKTFREKLEGLLKSNKLDSLFMKTRWGVHTFGMKFPIDCLVLDGELTVKALRENMKPNCFFFWPPRYRNVLELPSGAIAGSGTRVGDKIEFSGAEM